MQNTALPTDASRFGHTVGVAVPAAIVSLGCFHLSWCEPALAWLMPGYVLGLAWLTALPTARTAFYIALSIGFAAYAPHLGFFWTIFGSPAAILWGLLAIWPALFVLSLRGLSRRYGVAAGALALPILWTGLEYFRSEVWPLRFSWLSLGYAFSESSQVFQVTHLGLYGVGFLVAALAAPAWALPGRKRWTALAGGFLVMAVLLQSRGAEEQPGRDVAEAEPGKTPVLRVAGLQLEYPWEPELLDHLSELAQRHPAASLVVLSEYTLDGPPSDALLDWCRTHQRYLVVGGKDPLPEGGFFNTAFVISPDGAIVFRQAKSVPIQFFQDGRPASTQEVWHSPWGRLGLAVCYDLSYRRVMDRLVQRGAQCLIIPTVDDSSWGRAQHELHARVARVRAAEYRLPVIRIASSGISQFMDRDGRERACAPFPGQGKTLEAALAIPQAGKLPLDRHAAPWLCLAAGALLLGSLRSPSHRSIREGWKVVSHAPVEALKTTKLCESPEPAVSFAPEVLR